MIVFSGRIFLVGSHVGKLFFSLANENSVWLHIILKEEQFWYYLFSHKGNLVENSFGTGRKDILSLYTSKCLFDWCLLYNLC